ncbi:MAG: ATP-binding protein [Nanoarchaeota archaeon]
MSGTIKGQVIAGDYAKILIRQRSDADIELGELLVAASGDDRILLQVYDLAYGSQISQQNLELIAGLKLEEDEEFHFMEPELRNYKIAVAKALLVIRGHEAFVCKQLPSFFSEVCSVTRDDLVFLERPKDPLFLGDLRSGSATLGMQLHLKGADVLSHHILVAATTGRGKSNLTSCILWNLVGQSFAGVLVLDPHDEYYGRSDIGLKDHPKKENISYFTPVNPPPGASSLKINLKSLRPGHFSFINLSDPQRQAAQAYYRKYKTDWIISIILERELNVEFNEATLNVLRRRLMNLLNIDHVNGTIYCNGVFDTHSGESTIHDICKKLQGSSIVVVDTSHFSNDVELLIGNMIASEIFTEYKKHKIEGTLDSKPSISIVLEEAPRVLGKDVLEKGPNVFSSIAREGRKFKIGLFAITQLPSLIPRDILANMNTKIILGIEMNTERQSIIDSAAQDLSSDSRAIASLDKGEAIITSNFARFATPIKMPLFKKVVEETQNAHVREKYASGGAQAVQSFSGVGLRR